MDPVNSQRFAQRNKLTMPVLVSGLISYPCTLYNCSRECSILIMFWLYKTSNYISFCISNLYSTDYEIDVMKTPEIRMQMYYLIMKKISNLLLSLFFHFFVMKILNKRKIGTIIIM